jgi:Cyclin, N-terminal domain
MLSPKYREPICDDKQRMKLLCRLASKYPDPELCKESIQVNSRVFRILTKYAKLLDIHEDVTRIAIRIMIRYLNKTYFTPKRISDAMRSLAVVCISIAEKWIDDPPYQRLYAEYSQEIEVPTRYLKLLEAHVLTKLEWNVASIKEDETTAALERKVIRKLTRTNKHTLLYRLRIVIELGIHYIQELCYFTVQRLDVAVVPDTVDDK